MDLTWLQKQFPEIQHIQPLKEGGQKWVYTVRHKEHGECVLKIVKPGTGLYLDRELEAVARMNEAVPKVFGNGKLQSQVGELIWILEERVEGTLLAEVIQNGPVPKDQLLTLAKELIGIAAQSEAQGVVHRDIKPANIILDNAGKAWLLDFGIARILDLESRTRTDAVIGPHSPGYSPLEQFRYQKRKIDGRADLFAIGVVLYEAATGVNPFTRGAHDRLEVLHRVETLRLPRLKLAWDSEGEFADLVATLTQKYPHQRPPSCQLALDWISDVIEKSGG